MSRNRNYLAQYLDLIDLDTHLQLGYVCDVSDNGLMFISEHPVPLELTKNVCIENKISSPDIPTFSIPATIKTIWQKPNINPELVCIGCVILEIAETDYQRLKEIVPLLSYDDNLIIHRTQHD